MNIWELTGTSIQILLLDAEIAILEKYKLQPNPKNQAMDFGLQGERKTVWILEFRNVSCAFVVVRVRVLLFVS